MTVNRTTTVLAVLVGTVIAGAVASNAQAQVVYYSTSTYGYDTPTSVVVTPPVYVPAPVYYYPPQPTYYYRPAYVRPYYGGFGFGFSRYAHGFHSHHH